MIERVSHVLGTMYHVKIRKNFLLCFSKFCRLESCSQLSYDVVNMLSSGVELVVVSYLGFLATC